jgi:hypothetical protein
MTVRVVPLDAGPADGLKLDRDDHRLRELVRATVVLAACRT